MLNYKRNFSLRQSSSPHESPFKRIRAQTPVLNQINNCALTTTPVLNQINNCVLTTTPNQQQFVQPAPPANPLPQQPYQPITHKENLEAEIINLNKQINSKFRYLITTKEKLIELQSRRYAFNDYMAIANHSQNQVRHHLNDIFNPGTKLADRAKNLIEESRKTQNSKLERLKFDMNKYLSSTHAAIEKKFHELIQERDNNLRTLEHIHQEREANRSMSECKDTETINKDTEMTNKEIEPIEKDDISKQITEDVLTDLTPTDLVPEEDCIIIDGQGSSNTTQEMRRGETPCDDDETDVERSDEDQTFTPCQAQKPN